MTSDLLFVYGTLMRGYSHPMARLLSSNADFLGPASCRGRLYKVKHYPGLVLSEDESERVFGELYRLRAVDDLLRAFDMYEACGEGFPEPTQYVRQMLPVTLAEGTARDAWTYIYNWPLTGLAWIETGRFL
jgi:gamma-glutamylcyclotransferase (GGCT)/AIG2-like uncharacterized protein YtfP